jgi:hypothetical protein
MVMRAHAAMSPIKQQRLGLDTTSTNGTFFFLLLEPTRVPWRRWLVNATNPTIFPGVQILESTSELEAYPTAPDAGDSWSATVLAYEHL